jgi:hypothetical protein
VAAFAGASSAGASVTLELVSVGGVGNNNYQTVTLVASGGINLNQSGVEAGVYNLTVNGVATPSFCIDIATEQQENTPYYDYNYSALASSPVDAVGPMGSQAATDIEKLWAAYYSPSMSSVQAAALQVAIWEDEANNSGNGNGGGKYTLTVSGNSAVTTEATSMLAALSGLTATADLIALTDSGQGYVVAVPEATTVIASVLLLLPFGASTLRILRRNRAS